MNEKNERKEKREREGLRKSIRGKEEIEQGRYRVHTD
jgi:hypothetical protein